jgi:hypothetical protein
MPEHIKYEDDDLFNPETHHESSDVPISALLWFIVVFIVFGVVSHFVILFFYKGLVKAEKNRMDPPRSAVARPANADVPQNQPLLQPFPKSNGNGDTIPPQADTPVVDMVDMRSTEAQRLGSYGWVDRERGTVHMPIQVAKETLAARLAVQGQLGTTPATPATTTQPAAPGSVTSPAGTPVPPDTGATQPATTNTAGGTHQ